MINFHTSSASPTVLEDTPSLPKAHVGLEQVSLKFGEMVATDTSLTVDMPPPPHSDSNATILPFIETLPAQPPAEAALPVEVSTQDTAQPAAVSTVENTASITGERRPQTDMDAAILPWIETPPAQSPVKAPTEIPTTISQPADTDTTISPETSQKVQLAPTQDSVAPPTAPEVKAPLGVAHSDTAHTENSTTRERDQQAPRLDAESPAKTPQKQRQGTPLQEPQIRTAESSRPETATPLENASTARAPSTPPRIDGTFQPDASLQMDSPQPADLSRRTDTSKVTATETTIAPTSNTPETGVAETVAIPASQALKSTEVTASKQNAPGRLDVLKSSASTVETKVQTGQPQSQPEAKFDHIDAAQAPKTDTTKLVPAFFASLELTDIPSINPPALGASPVVPSGPTLSAPALAPTAPVPVIPPQAIVGVISERLVNEPDSSDRIVVQLDPPELGRVAIDFKFDAQGLQTVTITSESPEALKQLRLMHFELVQALEQNGLSGRDLTFAENTAGQSQHGAPSNTGTSSQDESSEQSTSEPTRSRPVQHSKTESGLDLKL